MHQSIKIHIITISEVIKWNMCGVIWMIDCSFYAACGLKMLLSSVCDGCHWKDYDVSGLIDPLVIFINVCVQGLDAPSVRNFDFHAHHCPHPTVWMCKWEFEQMVEIKFPTAHLNTPAFFLITLPHIADGFSPLTHLWSIWRAEHFLTWSFSFP